MPLLPYDYLHLVNCPEVVIISDILCRTKAKTTTGTAVFRGGLPVFRHSLRTPRVAKYLCLMFPNQEGAGGMGGVGGHVTYPGALVTELKSES